MVDFKRFSIYVANRKVRKGWDYIILPDGKRVSVEPGKYLKEGFS
uniref:Ribosomal protein S4 n=1 Tax=Ligamenvirales sp. TaxID=2832923 RepID=A0AAU6PXD2_9VIRU